jgi:hypothetical protein
MELPSKADTEMKMGWLRLARAASDGYFPSIRNRIIRSHHDRRAGGEPEAPFSSANFSA